MFIGVIDEERLCPLILSTSIILEGETSDKQVYDVLSTIAGCGKRFKLWAEVLEHSHPSYQHDIPYPISLNIGKLGSGGALTSYTCNGERKTVSLIVDQLHEAAEAFRKDDSDDIFVLEVDCWKHLRKVWLRGITKFLSTLLDNTMREELDEIDS